MDIGGRHSSHGRKEIWCLRTLSTDNYLNCSFKVPCTPAWWFRGILKPWYSRKLSAHSNEAKCTVIFQPRYNQVISIWSQIDPGSKDQEQFLPKEKSLSWVVAHLPNIAGIKVWKPTTDFRLTKWNFMQENVP